ncbi:MAG: ABC transporter permease [Planctomycetota bacterium]
MRILYQDIRFAIRMLVKNPGFTIPAVLCLALGIGACTAIFSVVNAVLIRPLPYTNPQQLVAIDEYNLERDRHMGASNMLLLDLREQIKSFEGIALSHYTRFHLTGGEFPEKISASRVSPNLFELLGANPLFGRTFLPSEDQPGKSDVAIISHSLWQRRFGGDPNLVGQRISFTDMQPRFTEWTGDDIKDKVYTVIGIMPPRFLPVRTIGKCEMWVPLVFQPDESNDRNIRAFGAIGRLKGGASRRQAQAEVDLLAQRLAEKYPDIYKSWTIQLSPLRNTFVFGDIRKRLSILLVAVGFVLLIACANVANMLLARGASRQAEVAVRSTLGADRWRVIRQLLTESVLLSFLGAVLGLLLAHWGIGLLKPLISSTLPLSEDVGIDARVLGWTLFIMVMTGVSCGLAPAWQLSKQNLTQAIKEGGSRFIAGPGRKPLRDLLVVSQVALALVLLIGAGLMIQTLVRLLRVDPNFDPHNLLEFKIHLPLRKYGGFSGQQRTFFEQLLERLESLPGVLSVGYISGRGTGGETTAEGKTTSMPYVDDCQCSVGTYDYLRTMEISLLHGRYLTNEDVSGKENNVIINDLVAHGLWPGGNPIGKRINYGSNLLTVVGVVKNTRTWSYAYEGSPQLYIPYKTCEDLGRAMSSSADFVVRSSGDPLSLVNAIRNEVRALDSQIPVEDFMTLEDRLRRSTVRQRLYMRLLTAFAVMGLVLTAVGIYGVIAYAASRRTHEIGVRMALGAKRNNVLALVIRKGLTLILVGVIIGVAGALALTRLLKSFLYGVTTTDPVTFIAVSLLLIAVGLIACYIPARRATKIDPMSALRYE